MIEKFPNDDHKATPYAPASKRLLEAIGDVIDEQTGDLAGEIAALEKRIHGLEAARQADVSISPVEFDAFKIKVRESQLLLARSYRSWREHVRKEIFAKIQASDEWARYEINRIEAKLIRSAQKKSGFWSKLWAALTY